MKEAPDIIILSDTAGSLSEFSSDEISILKEYLQRERCKHLIGTYALFQYSNNNQHFDNRRLCELFGIHSHLQFCCC